MPYINTFPPTPNEDNIEYLVDSYEFLSDEYHDAWMFHQILESKWPYINYSDIFEDVILRKGNIETKWAIFFSVRKQDADRLRCIINRFPNSKLDGCYIIDDLPWVHI